MHVHTREHIFSHQNTHTSALETVRAHGEPPRSLDERMKRKDLESVPVTLLVMFKTMLRPPHLLFGQVYFQIRPDAPKRSDTFKAATSLQHHPTSSNHNNRCPCVGTTIMRKTSVIRVAKSGRRHVQNAEHKRGASRHHIVYV